MLIVTMADPRWFTLKKKQVIYSRAFVELYNWKNNGQIHEIYRIIELEKTRTLTMKNLRNLSAHRIIERSLVLCNAQMVFGNQDKFVFYVNNYINLDQFNYLYDLDWIKKDVRNVDVVAYKLGSALTRATNDKLEVAREKK